MSKKVDERVVELKFNTKQFEDGVRSTTESLADLNQALQLEGVSNGIDSIASKFNVFGAVAFTAIQTLTTAAIGFGQKIAGAILDPLIEGGRKRALNIEQAKFQFKGLGMDVEQSMADALYAVKGTAFGLDEAAVAASQFGASGVRSGTEMQNALRGISGVAAMAGSSYTDMANVFTKVAGQGRLMGDDLNRLGTRGINAAATLADYFNKTGRAVNATEKDIRDMVTKGQIDFKTFSEAMSATFGEHATKASETYTGALSNMRAALARLGQAYFTPQLERSRQLFVALTPAIDFVTEAVKPLIDLFNNLADKALANVIAMLNKLDFNGAFANLETGKLNYFAEGFKKIATLIQRFSNIISNAFTKVFGEANIKSIDEIGKSFFDFTETLNFGSKAGERIGTIFTGIFTVIKAVGSVLAAIGKVIWSVFSNAVKILTSFFGIFTPLIDAYTKFNKANTDVGTSVGSLADKFTSFMDRVVQPLIDFFNKLRDAIQGVVDTKLGKWAEEVGEDFAPLDWLGEKIVAIFTGIKAFVVGVWNVIEPIVNAIGNVFKQLGEGFKRFADGMDFSIIFGAANTGILFYFANAIKNLFSDGIGEITKVTGIFGSIKDIFDNVTGVLEAMQTKLKAEALMKIAIAIGILAASMFLLGTINPDNIGSAVVGMATIMGALLGVMASLDKLTTMAGAAKLPLIAAAMIMVSAAILVLSVALKVLSTMSWDEIGRGLTVLAGGLLIMVGAILLLQFAGPMAILGAAALLILSAALLTLSVSMKILATMSWEEIGKGLVALAGGLAIMVGAVLLLQFAGPLAIVAAAALLILAGALAILVGAIYLLGRMNIDTLTQGLLALIAVLGIMVLAIMALGFAGPIAIAGAAAMLIMSAAILVLTISLTALGALPADNIAQALGTIAAALGILIGLGTAMGILSPLLILGGAALLIFASALLLLTVSLTVLSLLPADGISQALGTIAAALGIIIGLGTALGLLSPILLLAGIALGVLGLALIGFAAGMLLFGISLGMLATNGPGAAEGLRALAEGMLAVALYIPIMAAVGVALIAFGAGAIVAGAGIAVLAIGLALLSGALALLGMTAPVGAMGMVILTAAMIPIIAKGLEFAALGAAFIVLGAGLLVMGVGAVLAGAGLIVLAAGMRQIAASGKKGTQALKKVVKAIAGMIWQLPQLGLMAAGFLALGAALLVLGAGAMLAGAGGLLLAAAMIMLNVAATMGAKAMELVAKATANLAPSVPTLALIAAAMTMLSASFAIAGAGGVAAAAGITAMIMSTTLGTAAVIAFAGAISANIPMAIAVFSLMAPAASKASDGVSKAFQQIQNGIQRSIPGSTAAVNALVVAIAVGLISRMAAYSNSMYSSGYNTGLYFTSGLAAGINSGRSSAINAAINVAAAALRAANDRLAIRSPSRETHWSGEMFDKGFAGGINDNAGMVVDASEGVADSALIAMRDAMSGATDVIFDNLGGDPVIKPVLDLSAVKKDAGTLSNLFKNDSIPVHGSYNTASSISANYNKSLEERSSGGSENVENVQNVIFNQNIQSPKALNTSEVYRNTKNQISVAKEKLKT